MNCYHWHIRGYLSLNEMQQWPSNSTCSPQSSSCWACRVTTALGFFSTAYTLILRCAALAAARARRTSGPRPAPTTISTLRRQWWNRLESVLYKFTNLGIIWRRPTNENILYHHHQPLLVRAGKRAVQTSSASLCLMLLYSILLVTSYFHLSPRFSICPAVSYNCWVATLLLWTGWQPKSYRSQDRQRWKYNLCRNTIIN